MRIKVSKNAIIGPLSQVLEAVNPRNAIPALAGVLFVASKSGLKIVGGDIDVTVIRMIPERENELSVVRLGSIVLPSINIMDSLRYLPEGEIDIDVKGLVAKITAGRSVIEIPGISADEYSYPPFKPAEGLKIETLDLKSMIKRTVFAASTNKSEKMQALLGLRIKVESGILTISSCDRTRIAKVGANVDSDLSFECTISTAGAGTIAKIFEDKEISLHIEGSGVCFIGENVQARIGIIDSEYPPIDKLFAVPEVAEIKIPRKDIKTAIHRVKAFADQDRVLMQIGTELKLIGKSQNGRSDDVITPDDFEGEEQRIAVNGKKMLEALDALEGSAAIIKYCESSPAKSLVITDGEYEHDIFQLAISVCREGEFA